MQLPLAAKPRHSVKWCHGVAITPQCLADGYFVQNWQDDRRISACIGGGFGMYGPAVSQSQRLGRMEVGDRGILRQSGPYCGSGPHFEGDYGMHDFGYPPDNITERCQTRYPLAMLR